MRDILFRGKLINQNMFVTGYYFFSEKENKHYIVGEPKDYGFLKAEVIPETVGQYTGLNDKSGVKIFEGDIVKTTYNIVVIKWANTGFLPYRNNGFKYSKVTNWDSVHNGEVIGNIHDNPELLEGK